MVFSNFVFVKVETAAPWFSFLFSVSSFSKRFPPWLPSAFSSPGRSADIAAGGRRGRLLAGDGGWGPRGKAQ